MDTKYMVFQYTTKIYSDEEYTDLVNMSVQV